MGYKIGYVQVLGQGGVIYGLENEACASTQSGWYYLQSTKQKLRELISQGVIYGIEIEYYSL